MTTNWCLTLNFHKHALRFYWTHRMHLLTLSNALANCSDKSLHDINIFLTTSNRRFICPFAIIFMLKKFEKMKQLNTKVCNWKFFSKKTVAVYHYTILNFFSLSYGIPLNLYNCTYVSKIESCLHTETYVVGRKLVIL